MLDLQMVLAVPYVLFLICELSPSLAACVPLPAAHRPACLAVSDTSSQPPMLTEEPAWTFQGSASEVHTYLNRKIILHSGCSVYVLNAIFFSFLFTDFH